MVEGSADVDRPDDRALDLRRRVFYLDCGGAAARRLARESFWIWQCFRLDLENRAVATGFRARRSRTRSDLLLRSGRRAILGLDHPRLAGCDRPVDRWL